MNVAIQKRCVWKVVAVDCVGVLVDVDWANDLCIYSAIWKDDYCTVFGMCLELVFYFEGPNACRLFHCTAPKLLLLPFWWFAFVSNTFKCTVVFCIYYKNMFLLFHDKLQFKKLGNWTAVNNVGYVYKFYHRVEFCHRLFDVMSMLKSYRVSM